jgi:hypothetical protein
MAVVNRDLEERVKRFMFQLDCDAEGDSSDLNMGEDTISNHVRLLETLKMGMFDASKLLSRNELARFVDSAESLYGMNFYSGTGYGTCYGVRQVLEIVSNIRSNYAMLGSEETRLEYLSCLDGLYKIRQKQSQTVIPFVNLLESRDPSEFPNSTIDFLNKKLSSAVDAIQKSGIMKGILKEAERIGYY